MTGLDFASWRPIVARFQEPSRWRAVWQLVTSVGLYGIFWFLIHRFLPISFWLAWPCAILAGCSLARVFIIFHDCGHGSFFRSQRANAVVGFFTGLLTLTPYSLWRREHAGHHASAGDLDRRGAGDIWTMTVEEYLAAPWRTRLAYRFARNPFVLFGLAPLLLFGIRYRFVPAKAERGERRSVYCMNFTLLGMAVGMSLLFGFKDYLLLQLTVTVVSGAIGFWMFYVQHQFEDVYWERREDWDFTAAAMEGSSFYRLPRFFQWLTGNIGFHHIHHLSPRIPNYNLERCHRALPLAQTVKPIGLRASLKSLPLRLWDEKSRKMVGYRKLRERRRGQTPA